MASSPARRIWRGDSVVARRHKSRYYIPEEICYENAGVLTLGNDRLRFLVANALSKVPRSVVDNVVNRCLFVMPIHEEKGIFIPKELLRGKCVIALPEKLLGEDEEEIEHTILHEVAHFYHGHKSPLLLEECADRQQEEEADRTVELWLEKFRSS